MATRETDAAVEIRLRKTDGRFMHPIEDALARIRHDKLGICAECGQPIWMARLEAEAGPGGLETAGSSRALKAETQTFAAIPADILVSIWCLFL
jgi:hypothetical protein